MSGLIIASAARTSGNSRQRPTKINRSVLLKAGLFGPVRRRTLICWRSTRFSASSADLEQNRPTSAHQISLQTSLIPHSINRFALTRYWMRFALGTGGKEQEHAMSNKENDAVASVIGIDIGKNSFHIVGQDHRGAIVLRQKWSRGQIEARLANLPPCLIGMEACVGAHHLSRKLQALGPSPKKSPFPWSATTASFPCSDRTETLTLPSWI